MFSLPTGYLEDGQVNILLSCRLSPDFLPRMDEPLLRQVVYERIREDKAAGEVRRETRGSTEITPTLQALGVETLRFAPGPALVGLVGRISGFAYESL